MEESSIDPASRPSLASCTTAEDLAAALAARCSKATLHKSSWKACCPAHEDRTPSLSITPANDKVLLHCYAGCQFEAVLAGLGIEKKDLFLSSPAGRPLQRRKDILAEYDYFDQNGTLLFQVIRLAPLLPKKFLQRHPDPVHPGHWIDNRGGIPFVLYRLPHVLRAVEAGARIYITEGEKDADTVARLGLEATTNPVGAGKWDDTYTATLAGASVVLLQDNDEAGEKHVHMVASRLAGIAKDIRILLLPGLPNKGDVSDWVAAGGTCGQLEALANAVSPYGITESILPGPEPLDPYACPPLPAFAQVNPQEASEASLFLTEYVAYSAKWAPRAYEGFHTAVALFLLSTIAARRIRILFGGGMYTSLYIALAARTSLYTKSTAADIGIELLSRTGLGYLLADDDATPQAFIRSMGGAIDQGYATMNEDEQATERSRLAFAAQRGWFYEEWGQHIQAMMSNHEGVMTSFRSILRRMDDHKEEYVYSTISRGRERLRHPYITLLANITPADLQPFIKRDSRLWGDGFMARFAFVTPDPTLISIAPFPREQRVVPSPLIRELHDWHVRLGIPTCDVRLREERDAVAPYEIIREPLPETPYTLSPPVWDAFYAYDQAIRELISQSSYAYLDASYARLPIKALRIAGLLASLHDVAHKQTIWPSAWACAQMITETWRRDLHRLIQQVQTGEQEPSVKRTLEEQLLRQVRERGPQTLREFALFHKAQSRDDLQVALKSLVNADALVRQETGRTIRYDLLKGIGEKDTLNNCSKL